MTPLVFLLLSVAGGAGAAARFVVDGAVKARVGARFPWGTTLINVSGSLTLGLLTGLATTGRISDASELVLGVGFLGGYTTFSTASFETIRLLQERRIAEAAANAFGSLVVAVAAAIVGYLIGSAG